jgi:hypothetical protein
LAKILRGIGVLAISAAGIAIVAAVGSHATSNDYVEYWSSAKLFLHGVNPYASAGVLELEKAHGFLLNSPLIMLNPPWSLPLIAWLGTFTERMGLNLWVLFLASCTAAAIVLLDIPKQNRVLAFLFAPVLASFLMMQSSPLLLLGWALFLRYRKTRPFWAGAALALLAIKPHLFLLVWLVLLVHSIYSRSLVILSGFAVALAALSAVVTLRLPSIWQDYWSLIHNSSLQNNNFPTLPTLLRASINVQWTWLALVPTFLAMMWAIAYYWKNRFTWSWSEQGMLVLLVSIATSPYSWASDQIVLLPILAVAFRPAPRRFAFESLAILNVAALALICTGSRLCIALPLTWLLWYGYASWRKAGPAPQQASLDQPVCS